MATLDRIIDRLPLPAFLKHEDAGKHYGVIGDFDTPEDLLRAIRTARAAGYSKLEAYTPFPIHGIDEALGEGRSPLGKIVIVCGLAGLTLAILLQWWTGAIDYPLVVAGKPLFAFEPSVPIMFELSVLLAAFGAVLGMLALNKLPQYYHPAFNYSKWAGATNDRFLLAIEAKDPRFSAEEAITFLNAAGSRHSELVEA
ncbi:MAG: DUF3341 domain-containing protein [Bryobacteraceae bacterium]|nr:DUF3341 domain-containing protein [Bryobacteraceae bacterium]